MTTPQLTTMTLRYHYAPCTHVPHVLCRTCTRYLLPGTFDVQIHEESREASRSVYQACLFSGGVFPGRGFILDLCAICRFSTAQGNFWEGAFLPVWWSAFWQAASQWLQWLKWYPLESFRELRGAYYLASLALLTQLCTYNSAQPRYWCTFIGGKLRVA